MKARSLQRADIRGIHNDEGTQQADAFQIDSKARRQLNEFETIYGPAGRLNFLKASPEQKAKIICGSILVMHGLYMRQVQIAQWRTESCEKVIALALGGLVYKKQHGRFPANSQQLATRFESAEVLQNSSTGEPLEITNRNGHFQIRYSNPISDDLDFRISMPVAGGNE